MSSMAAMLCDSDPPSSPSSSHAPASNTASHDNHEKINLRGSAWRPSAAGALLLLYCYLTIYAWIYENGAEKLNSRPKRAFFDFLQSQRYKIKSKSVLFSSLYPFIFLSLPSFLYFLPIYRA